ncbi:MAG: phenylalanine--tRNA ligase subunit beta [Candidatus Woesebacteria bacterium]|jgi:phenylalanyl-tRNA synthetase beta chain
MNILIPHKWLLEHLDTKASPEKIQEYLSLCGPSVERIYDKGDKVYDIEITTNRVDSMSVRGVAREAAVILQQFGIDAKLKKSKIKDPQYNKKNQLPLPKIVNDPHYCKRVICVILKDIKRTPTPKWMAERLEQIDVQVHESAIDITNYITHELGHPVHAFDYDKIMELGGEIIVKEAEPGKTFITLDNEKYETVGGEIVFENSVGEIIDLPAIMGTVNSSINQSTKNVLLWIEALDAKKVRHGSMTHAIRTVAAQLEEKHVDPHLAEDVLKRGIELYQELCDAKVASEIYDEFPGKAKAKTVSISSERIYDYLGIKLEQNKIKNILLDLGCELKVRQGKNSYQLDISPPTFRPDIKIPADVIEEIARIYGYHNLPSVLMPTAIPLTKPTDVNFTIENKIKHFLANIGWQEIYTYSMVSEKLAQQSNYKTEHHLKLANPLTEDKVYLRRSLIPSLIEAIEYNQQRKKMSAFELANVYHPQTDNLPNEELRLTMLSNRAYRKVKGDLEALLNQFYINDIKIEEKESQTADILTSEKLKLGTIKILKNKMTAIDITMATLIEAAHAYPNYQAIPKTAAINEDLTFKLKKKTRVGDVIDLIKQSSLLINKVQLSKIYKQNYTFNIEYLDPKKNISNTDVEPIRRQIVNKIEKTFNAKLIGLIK